MRRKLTVRILYVGSSVYIPNSTSKVVQSLHLASGASWDIHA